MQLDFRYNELRRWLRSSTVEVEFTAKDNNKRVMYCTLNPDVVGVTLDAGFNYVDNDNLFTVWDIDNNGWRSFKPDHVLNYKEVSTIDEGSAIGMA